MRRVRLLLAALRILRLRLPVYELLRLRGPFLMKPRRTGTIMEYQNGHYFMYLTEWSGEHDADGRAHREIEVYYAKARVVANLEGDPLWNTTDQSLFARAFQAFRVAPEVFEKTGEAGDLP